MKTNNQILDNIIETQTEAVNNWLNTTKKFQSAVMSGNIATEGQSIYKDWMDKQMSILGGVQANFTKQTENNKPEDFFKNWYTQQLDQIKKMTDFNQSVFNSFANFGKNPTDYANNFSNVNQAWTKIYNTWMGTLNSTYDTFSKHIPSSLNQDAFKKIFEGQKTYLALQEFWQPMFEAFKGGNFTVDAFKKYYQPETYKHISEQIIHSFQGNTNLKDVFEASIKNIQDFFVNQNNLAKEYTASFQNIANEYPQLISGDFAKLSDMYKNIHNVFTKSFEPVLKLAQPGKEKEAVEDNLMLLDKISEYAVKQAQLQYHLYSTTQKAVETSAQHSFEKLTSETMSPEAFKEFYNEWLKTNETLFIDLFGSEDFSKLKGEILGLTMDVKKHFEKQFENVFSNYPLVFKSETEELYKTIYDLKKQVKNLETRLAAHGAAALSFDDEEKTTSKAGAKKK